MSSQKAMINTLMFYHWDDTLFNEMLIPDGVDRDDVIQAILLETSDFPLVITDLPTLKLAIKVWSKHKIDIWTHLLATTHYIYNPIENYNRLEVETTLLEKRGTGSIKGDGGNDTVTYNVTDTSSGTDNYSESGTTANTGDITTAKTNTGSVTASGSDRLVNSGTDGKTGTETITETNDGSDVRSVADNTTETNSGADVTAAGKTDTTTKTGDDTLTVSGTVTTAKTGYDTVTESVSAFNEQNSYADHTKTATDYNSGDTRTENRTDQTDYNTTETLTEDLDSTLTYGKKVVTDKSITDTMKYGKEVDTSKSSSESVTYGKTETTNYGKSENTTGSENETVTNDTLTSVERESSSTKAGSNVKTGTETHSHSQGNVETRNFDDTFTANRHITGNIGVMTTQDMIKQEREIALFDIIDVIVADYKSEFCILIY